MTEYAGTQIKTYTGRMVDPCAMMPEDVEIEHIAHALATINRFGGAAKYPYSVAQHSVLAERVAVQMTDNHSSWLWMLLHDAPEAYGIPDVTRPVKHRVRVYYPDGLVTLGEHEDRIMRVICERFALPFPVPGIVKLIDRSMVVTEAEELIPHGNEEWVWAGPPPVPYEDVKIEPWRWPQAKDSFLNRFRELHG